MEVIKIKDVYEDEGYIKAGVDFKDMMISALRYALPRHSYIVSMTCNYIKNHASLILDERVIGVMLRDIDWYLEDMKNGVVPSSWKSDIEEIEDLRRFLESYGV